MKSKKIGWDFWLKWVLLMTGFLALSYTGIDDVERPIVTRLVSDPWTREIWMVLGIGLLGGLVGVAQWLLLRRFIAYAIRWGLIMALTYWVGASLTEIASFTGIALVPSFSASFVLLGPVCGILQWRILRSHVDRAGWWIVTQTLSWLVLFAVSALVAYGFEAIFGGNVDNYLPIGYALGGAAVGAISGLTLIWLLRGSFYRSKVETIISLNKNR
jgi:hypothetical protein